MMYDFEDYEIEKWGRNINELIREFDGSIEDLIDEMRDLYRSFQSYIHQEMSRNELIKHYDSINEELWNWDIDWDFLFSELEWEKGGQVYSSGYTKNKYGW
jgi:hypothetical protein